MVVAANGGSDLIYVPDNDRDLAGRVVDFLTRQDYVSGVFVDEQALGPMPGALPLSAIGLRGSAKTPVPSIVVNFSSFATDPADPNQSGVQIADTSLQQGQGMHGDFSRANTYNNMAAIGPDFKQGYQDTAPASNADVTPTLAKARSWSLETPFSSTSVGISPVEAQNPSKGGDCAELAGSSSHFRKR